MKLYIKILPSLLLCSSTLSITASPTLSETKKQIETRELPLTSNLKVTPAEDPPIVQIAILLDTSTSMNGLIEQAKTQLWSIVNTFNRAKHKGQMPILEVALYEYGKQTLNPESHWLRRIHPLSRDLDGISESLFALKTNGGDEHCGAVIRRAVDDLEWDESPTTYRAIFIAGNEAFTQGEINVSQSCLSAKKNNILVNTIHCGNQKSGVNDGWNIGPTIAGGSLLTIDQNATVSHIESPQDKLIIELNLKLNDTYIGYGSQGQIMKTRQTIQDRNAARYTSAGAAVNRSVTKSSSNYHNSSWDLVDSNRVKRIDWNTIEEKNLPENMRSMTPEERTAHITKMTKKRTDLQTQIKELDKKRRAFITNERKKITNKEANTIDKVIGETIQKQAQEKGYKFDQ